MCGTRERTENKTFTDFENRRLMLGPAVFLVRKQPHLMR